MTWKAFKKMMENFEWPTILVFVGAILSASGALWVSQKQVASEKELRQKSDEIAELNKQIALSITGGNSFAYIAPIFTSDGPPLFALIHQGQYPLYDLNVRIVDLAKFEKMVMQKRYSLLDMQKDEVHLIIGNISPTQSQILGPISSASEHIRWNIFFSARNGFFTESLRIRKVNNEWKGALKVTNSPTTGPEKILFEKIDPDYPRTKEGKVDWDEKLEQSTTP